MVSIAPAVTNEERQDGEEPEEKENRAEAPERPPDMPLALLPVPPEREFRAPRPLALEAIDRLLSQIVSEEALERERARRTLLEAKPDWVSGITRRINSLAERADRKSLKQLLSSMREKTLQRVKHETGTKGQTPDYLDLALEHPAPKTQAWRDLSQLLAMSRMLAAIGTTEATRQIIYLYVRFGEFIRIECQRQLDALGDNAVPALIETQRHPARKLATWAKRRLKLLGKLSPHQAVRTDDDRALADTLVALGRNRDPDSTKLLISFAGTERAQIRLAARQGIVLLGEVASWQLKDAYLNTTGKRPPRDWTWKRAARELFTEFDRLRLARVYTVYGKARSAEADGDLERMRQGYDHVLALNPLFEGRNEMVAGYRKYAEFIQETDLDLAILALRRAERIAKDDSLQQKVKGDRRLLEAKLLRTRGIADRGLIEEAASLNPESSAASAQLLSSNTTIAPAWGIRSRYLSAVAISTVALLGAAWISFSGWRRTPSVCPRKQNSGQSGASTAQLSPLPPQPERPSGSQATDPPENQRTEGSDHPTQGPSFKAEDT